MGKDDLLGQFSDLLGSKNKDDTNLEEIVENGLTENNKNLEELFNQLNDSLTDDMKKIIDILNGISDDSKEIKEFATQAMGMGSNDDKSSPLDNFKKTDDIKAPKTGYTKVEELANIDQNYALSGLVLYYKLDDIQNAIMPYLKKIGINSKNNYKDNNESSNKENNFTFKNLDGIEQLSDTLKTFAKAVALLSLVPKKSAEAGVDLFINTIKKFNDLAEEVSNNKDNMESLLKNAQGIDMVIRQYAKTCVILTLCLPFAATSLVTMTLFKGFIIMANVTAEIIKGNIQNYAIMCIGLKTLAKGFLLMGAAFVTMALVLPFIPFAMVGILATIGVMIATAALGALAVSIIPILLIFPSCAIAMASGYLAMFLAVALLSLFRPDWESIDSNLEGIKMLMEKTGEMTVSIAKALPAALLLTLAGTLLFVGFTTMYLSLFVGALLGHFIGDGEWLVSTMDILKTSLFDVIGNVDFIKSVGLGIAASLLLALFGGTFTVAMTLMLISVAELLAIEKILNKIESPETIGKRLRDVTTGVIYGILGLDDDGDTGFWDVAKATAAAVGLSAVAMALIPFAISSAILFLTFNLTLVAIGTLKDKLDDLGTEGIRSVMESLGFIMKTLADSTEAFHDMSAKTIIAIGSLVKDVAEAIDTLTDVVIKLKDGIPKEQVDIATDTIKYICIKLFGDPDSDEDDGEYNLTKLFKTLASSKLKKLKVEATASLIPIVETLDKLADLVIKIATNENFTMERINAGAEAVQRVADLMAGIAASLHPLVKGSGWFGLGKSPLEALEEVNKSDFFGFVKNIMHNFSEASQLAMSVDSTGIAQFMSFFNQDFEPFVEGSKRFEKGMDNLGDAMGKIKDKDLDKLQRLMNILSVDSSGITQTINSLSMFANNAPKFNTIANAFERMSSSMETMSKKVGKLNGFFDKISRKSNDINSAASSISSQNGGSQLDPAVQMIFNVINSWDSKGVPIRAEMNRATGEIKPKDVGNDTGRASARYY